MMNRDPQHIVFAGGGTLGHLVPGIVVARELRRQDRHMRVTFITSESAREQEIVAINGFEHLALPARGVPNSAWNAMRFLRENFAGYQRATRFHQSEGVDLVVGLGGYSSVPAAKAAATCGIPLVLLEQNAVPGRANRWLAPSAALVCIAFDEARHLLKTPGPIRCTGNPVRSNATTDAPSVFDGSASRTRRLLVLGGSGGSRELNLHVPRALYKAGGGDGWHVVHQTGRADAEAVARLYQKLAVAADVTPFIDNVPAALDRADLAITRAGGTTLAELSVAETPAIIVPWREATDDHQTANANAIAAGGAAIVVPGGDVGGRLDDRLAVELERLLYDSGMRAKMSVAMAAHGRDDAAWQVASMIRDLLRRPHRLAG